ncbi:MAG: tRNA (guanosine(46)-N7)-methyltransferase TrmB [Alphaproteobacteria bacterium]|nr:tRNA (guanosine(46)-N7)-methyltransferase TrmB [Alphaproteobacteria bacterium]
MAGSRGNGSISSTSCGGLSELSGGEPPHPRRLYGRKRGRPLRRGQQILVETLLPRLAIDLPRSGGIDLSRLFPDAPLSVWLEIGFGAGEHLTAQAEAHRDIGFIGCEVFENGIAKLLGQVEPRRLANIRLFTDDARLLIAALPPASIGRVFVLFPDPWPKARHHKRRIVSTETLDQLSRIMADDAELRLATDDQGYFAWMLERVANHPAFEWLARRPADWRGRPSDWPPTRYEQNARAAGRSALFLRARRIQRRGPHREA